MCSATTNRTIRHEQTPAYSGSKIIYTISENVRAKPRRDLDARA